MWCKLKLVNLYRENLHKQRKLLCFGLDKGNWTPIQMTGDHIMSIHHHYCTSAHLQLNSSDQIIHIHKQWANYTCFEKCHSFITTWCAITAMMDVHICIFLLSLLTILYYIIKYRRHGLMPNTDNNV